LKKAILLLSIVTLIILISGCDKKDIQQAAKWKRKEFIEFRAIFSDYSKKHNLRLSDEEMDSFLDITPPSVFEETGCQIFKNGKTCESYLLYEVSLYTLGIGFGGLGIVDIETCKFKENEKKGLLYTYSWGSGLHRSGLGYFNLSEKRESDVDISSDKPLGFIQEDLVLKKISDTRFEVYTANITIDGGNFAKLTYKADRMFGEIKNVEGKPILFTK
jgi:hypothetical protein